MVLLLVERRYTKRLNKLITDAQADYIKYGKAIEQYKHLDALTKSGMYSTKEIPSKSLTKRNFSGTLH